MPLHSPNAAAGKTAVFRAPAKINLFLHVCGKFPDGYHQIQTVFQLIDWHDELHFELNDTGEISRSQQYGAFSMTEDLTIRAAQALRQHCPGNQGVTIGLQKNIPIGSGLGGGSSDAAATLTALNRLWNLNLDKAELIDIATQLGADVPVFVHGKNAWAQGRGELLSDIKLERKRFLVIVPEVHVSTADVYRECQAAEYYPRMQAADYSPSIRTNSLKGPACRLYPPVAELFDLLDGLDAQPRMSGSGGAVFVDAEDDRRIREIIEKLPTTCRHKVVRAHS